jgi:hypothetical protein
LNLSFLFQTFMECWFPPLTRMSCRVKQSTLTE